jgi:predicted metal-dependent phosphotriesterase family hydrolase
MGLDHRLQLTRREALRLLGVGVGARIAADWAHPSDLVGGSLAQIQVGRRALTFPRGAIIRTVLNDIDPNTIDGATLMHEHLGSGRPGRRGGPPTAPSQDEAWMAEELIAAREKAGLRCIVAAQTSLPPPDILEYNKRIMAKTGVAVIAAGGYYGLQSYPPYIKTESEDQIADRLVQAAAEGRFGAFGEIGDANNEADLADDEKKVFRAVGKASARTGLPIFTHNNYSTGPNVQTDIALHQLDQLMAGGAKPASIAIGHVCCLDDPKADVIKQIAKRGAFVAFDRVTRQQQWVTDEHRLHMIQALLDAGYVDHLMLSSDNIGALNPTTGEQSFYSGPLHAREGGPGYARPLLLFVPLMRKAGISEETIKKITVDNPRRWLSFVPKAA